MRRTVARTLGVALVLLLAGVAGTGAWVWAQVRGSLPQLDGRAALPGLSAEVSVARDALGIPTITGATRADVAAALGFVHAQDRFFQMDLSRRRAAGELAALVGPPAVEADRAIRLHRFRTVAIRAVSLMAAADRAVLDAYTAGVNAGLAALAVRPPEYLLLRQVPVPWRQEDSLLVALSMFITLQDTDGAYESTLATMHDVLPPEMFEFLAPRRTEWDAPLTDEPAAVIEVPGPDVYDLRARRTAASTAPIALADRRRPGPRHQSAACGTNVTPFAVLALDRLGCALDWTGIADPDAPPLGSNSWAVAGRLTADGGALVSNDIHLPVRVPNTWYRALMEWPDASDGTRTGATSSCWRRIRPTRRGTGRRTAGARSNGSRRSSTSPAERVSTSPSRGPSGGRSSRPTIGDARAPIAGSRTMRNGCRTA